MGLLNAADVSSSRRYAAPATALQETVYALPSATMTFKTGVGGTGLAGTMVKVPLFEASPLAPAPSTATARIRTAVDETFGTVHRYPPVFARLLAIKFQLSPLSVE